MNDITGEERVGHNGNRVVGRRDGSTRHDTTGHDSNWPAIDVGPSSRRAPAARAAALISLMVAMLLGAAGSAWADGPAGGLTSSEVVFSGQHRSVTQVGPRPQKFRQIAVLTKNQATAIAAALRGGDAATVSGLIPEPYASSLNAGGQGLAPLFENCGTDGLPGGCLFGFESNPFTGQFGFQVFSIGAV